MGTAAPIRANGPTHWWTEIGPVSSAIDCSGMGVIPVPLTSVTVVVTLCWNAGMKNITNTLVRVARASAEGSAIAGAAQPCPPRVESATGTSGADHPFGKRRGAGAPVRRAFIERTDTAPSPLSRLLSGTNASRGGGGRGGRLRIALLVTLIWRLARSPHSTIRPARYWAELLHLDDPEGDGARAVRSTLLELERRGFVRTESRGPGKVPEIILCDESLNGLDYRLPYLLFRK